MKKKRILTTEEIRHLAKLANLSLSDDEIKKYSKQLEETIEYVENLKELDTKNTPPTSHTVNLKDIFFEDGEKNERRLTAEEVTKNAKNKKNNFFVVKRIL